MAQRNVFGYGARSSVSQLCCGFVSSHFAVNQVFENETQKKNCACNKVQLWNISRVEACPPWTWGNKISSGMFSYVTVTNSAFSSWALLQLCWVLIPSCLPRETQAGAECGSLSGSPGARLMWCFPFSNLLLTWRTSVCVCSYQISSFGIILSPKCSWIPAGMSACQAVCAQPSPLGVHRWGLLRVTLCLCISAERWHCRVQMSPRSGWFGTGRCSISTS